MSGASQELDGIPTSLGSFSWGMTKSNDFVPYFEGGEVEPGPDGDYPYPTLTDAQRDALGAGSVAHRIPAPQRITEPEPIKMDLTKD